MSNEYERTITGAAKVDLIVNHLVKAYTRLLESNASLYYTTIPLDTLNTLFRLNVYQKDDMYCKLPEDEVHVTYVNFTLLDKPHGKLRGDRFYVFKEGINIIVRARHKPLDIIIYKQGRKLAAWEVTNYKKTSFIPIYKLHRYIKNLKGSGFPNKYLVVNFPENLRQAIDQNMSEEWNIKEALKKIADNGITLIYWHKFTEPELEEQIIGWIEE